MGQGDLSLALAGTELIDPVGAGTVSLDGDHIVPGGPPPLDMGFQARLRQVPVTGSHSHTVPSSPPVAGTRPSVTSPRAPHRTGPVWPVSGPPSGTPRSREFGVPMIERLGSDVTLHGPTPAH